MSPRNALLIGLAVVAIPTALVVAGWLAIPTSAESAVSEPAASDEPREIRHALGSGAVVNWTRLAIEAQHSVASTGVAGRQEATEQRARQRIGPAIRDGLPAVSIRAGETLSNLMEDEELGATLYNRIKLWAVAEAHYYASGKVELVGELDLTVYLRPWTMSVAVPRPAIPTVSAYTGLVVDARGSGAMPAFAPRLLARDGDVLWDGALWRDAALETSPAVWVADVAHPAAARAGVEPLVVRANRASGPDLVLDDAGSQAVRRHLIGAPILGEGRVVVLVDR
jgi:hypothetical protein